ncbi:MAG: radical SAM protein [Pseudonocardiaceae bacterium]
MTPASSPIRSTDPVRVFATSTRSKISIAHDPLTGLTHSTGALLRRGRARLSPSEVASWPVVHPGDLPAEVPVSVCWSPLVRCNLACPHCLDDKQLPELDGSNRLRIVRLIAASGVLGVDISGGEPLLLRELGELADELTEQGCVVSVTTNGWHLQRRAEALAAHIDAVRISLDGPDALRHDQWRGRESFRRAIAGARAAAAHGIPTQLHSVLMRSTRHSAQEMVELAASLSVHGVTFLQMLPIGLGAALAAEEQLTDEQAQDTIAGLDVPTEVSVRVRTREAAGGFTVIRSDGQLWRNDPQAESIATQRPLRCAEDLGLTGRDGSA